MTYAPESQLECRHYLQGRYPQLTNNQLGIVGGDGHKATGTSYHLGADDLKMEKNPYSARTARDKAGLADPAIRDAACAFDMDHGWPELREFSVWLVDECRRPDPHPDTLDIREVIYSPDGVTVWTWDREKGQTSAPQQRGDASHLTHTHKSDYRDSTLRPKVSVFKRFYAEREGQDVLEVPIPFGEANSGGEPSVRVEIFQLALNRARPDLPPITADGRFGNKTKTRYIEVLGAAAGDGSLYAATQRDQLYAMAYTGPRGPEGPPGQAGKTPTMVRFEGPVDLPVTAAE